MLVFLIRLISCILIGFSMLAMWRKVSADPSVRAVIGLGFAARALGGIALFWISYLHLPIATSLQLGRGFWFFAPDGVGYFDYAAGAAASGLYGIVTLDPQLPSVFYIKALALLMYLIGTTPAVAILLNLLAYLGSCVLFVSWGNRLALGKAPMLLAVAAISFFPSWILWSFQPLKDTLFLLLTVAYAFVASRWLDSDPQRRFALASTRAIAALAVLIYAVASIRWYAAILLVAANSLAWLLTILRSSDRRLARAGAVLALLLVAAAVIPVAAGPYLPPFGRALFRPSGGGQLASVPNSTLEYIESKRVDSLATAADTMIYAGRRLRHAPRDGQPDAASLVERLFPRAVAMFLPRAVGTALGWVEIGGGRGLWILAELDTMFFDVVLLGIAWTMWRQRRNDFVLRPVFVHVAVTTLVLAAALCYQTANFGTLFRLRSMVAIGFVLLLFTVARRHDHPTISR